MPSDNNPVCNNAEGDDGRNNAPANRRNLGGMDGKDPGNPAPVGEAWIMLLFAAAAALVVYIRNRRPRVEG